MAKWTAAKWGAFATITAAVIGAGGGYLVARSKSDPTNPTNISVGAVNGAAMFNGPGSHDNTQANNFIGVRPPARHVNDQLKAEIADKIPRTTSIWVRNVADAEAENLANEIFAYLNDSGRSAARVIMQGGGVPITHPLQLSPRGPNEVELGVGSQ